MKLERHNILYRYFDFTIGLKNKKNDIPLEPSHENVLFIPSFTNFKQFREWLLQYMIGKPLVKGPKGYLPDVIISLSSKGYLRNDHSTTDLAPDDAMEMWTWLFENQERLGQLDLSDTDEYRVVIFYLKPRNKKEKNSL